MADAAGATSMLPVYCSKCGQPVTITYESLDQATQAMWACPYHACRSRHQTELNGRIVRVLARDEPERR